MTDLDADLADALEAIEGRLPPSYHHYVRRVEAELARLTQERDEWYETAGKAQNRMTRYASRAERLERRAEAAERALADTREALAAYRSALRSGEPETAQLREMSDRAFAASAPQGKTRIETDQEIRDRQVGRPGPYPSAPQEYRTKSGRVLTDADIQALADEAERGYDVGQLHPEGAAQQEPHSVRCAECGELLGSFHQCRAPQESP